jgi:hypothetical protein
VKDKVPSPLRRRARRSAQPLGGKVTDAASQMPPKKSRRLSFAFATLLSVFCVGACSTSRNESSAAECSKIIGGVQYFIGSVECLERLAQEPISGYWQVGHENSVFYSERPKELWELDPDATWLTFSEEVGHAAKRYLADGKVHLLKVDFIGSESERLGFYGPMPTKSGVYMKRIVRLSEVEEVLLRRGMPPNNSLERTRER